MMSHDKLQYQVRQRFLLRDKFILSRDITFMSHWRSRYTMTGKQVGAAIDAFYFGYLLNIATCCTIFAAFVRYILKHLFHQCLCPITF